MDDASYTCFRVLFQANERRHRGSPATIKTPPLGTDKPVDDETADLQRDPARMDRCVWTLLLEWAFPVSTAFNIHQLVADFLVSNQCLFYPEHNVPRGPGYGSSTVDRTGRLGKTPVTDEEFDGELAERWAAFGHNPMVRDANGDPLVYDPNLDACRFDQSVVLFRYREALLSRREPWHKTHTKHDKARHRTDQRDGYPRWVDLGVPKLLRPVEKPVTAERPRWVAVDPVDFGAALLAGSVDELYRFRDGNCWEVRVSAPIAGETQKHVEEPCSVRHSVFSTGLLEQRFDRCAAAVSRARRHLSETKPGSEEQEIARRRWMSARAAFWGPEPRWSSNRTFREAMRRRELMEFARWYSVGVNDDGLLAYRVPLPQSKPKPKSHTQPQPRPQPPTSRVQTSGTGVKSGRRRRWPGPGSGRGSGTSRARGLERRRRRCKKIAKYDDDDGDGADACSDDGCVKFEPTSARAARRGRRRWDARDRSAAPDSELGDPYNPEELFLWDGDRSSSWAWRPVHLVPFVARQLLPPDLRPDDGAKPIPFVPMTQDLWRAYFGYSLVWRFRLLPREMSQIVLGLVADYVMVLHWELSVERWRQRAAELYWLWRSNYECEAETRQLLRHAPREQLIARATAHRRYHLEHPEYRHSCRGCLGCVEGHKKLKAALDPHQTQPEIPSPPLSPRSPYSP